MDNPLILADADACKALQQFLKKVSPALQFLSADSIEDGVKGAMAFLPAVGGKEEPTLWFGWRFAQPVKEVVEVAADKVAEALKNCLDDRNWITCDDLKQSQMGFVNYQRSTWLKLKIADVKAAVAASPELSARLKAYAEAKVRVFGLTKEAKAKAEEAAKP